MATARTLPVQNALQLQRARQRRRQTIVTAIALAIIIAAWLIGYANTGSSDAGPYVKNVLPGADRIETRRDLYVGYQGDTLVGYAQVGTASGYGGPVEVLVGIDPDGNITGAQIVGHKETPGFFRLIGRENFLAQFVGLSYKDPMQLGDDIDRVSGATFSAEGVARSIREAVRDLSTSELNASVPAEHRSIKFGIPEATLIALFVVSYFLHKTRRKNVKHYGRWAVMLTGIVVLGFLYNKPFTLSNVVSLLAGFWPDWQDNLYWFLLLGGIFSVTFIQGKNPYCSWFCPFGGVQEILGSFTGAKVYRPRSIYTKLQWAQRVLAFGAIVAGLALRMPGAASYEPFGTLFNLKGSWPQWVLLVLVMLASLVIYRPWCNYICPLGPVVDYVGEVRHWAKDAWKNGKARFSNKAS
ncbi:FMN-binding protein [Aggregatilinea lenta]|uniref:FMN-binding protein n=1 Tax=Aggregatilinea lenta TaxID=913108 RepID=UPI000E5C51D4|nr:FMN-binding protein [Aggregatilinea lenta]